MWSKKKKFSLCIATYHLGIFTKVPIKCYYRQIMSPFLKFYMAFMEGGSFGLASSHDKNPWQRSLTCFIAHRASVRLTCKPCKINKVLYGGVCLFVCSIHRTQGVLKPNLFQCFLASENLVPPLISQASLWPLLSLREPKLHRH